MFQLNQLIVNRQPLIWPATLRDPKGPWDDRLLPMTSAQGRCDLLGRCNF